MTAKEVEKPSLLISFIPIIILIVLLYINVQVFSDDATYGSNQIALLLAAAIAASLSFKLGYTWESLLAGIVSSIRSSLPAVLILLMIGALAGTWLISGVVPAMIYYGLNILSPSFFLGAAVIISAAVSLATGSSWSTIATLGVALLAIGNTFGITPGLTAGAIISGAYFGDKMSPLSDTTNLAPAMAGTDLFTHIRHMAYTTVPSISIALVIFIIIGFNISGDADLEMVSTVQSLINQNFNIHLGLFIIPAIVIFLIIKKMPALPALFIGTISAAIFAIIFQPDLIMTLAGEGKNFVYASYEVVITAMAVDINVETGNAMVDKLLGTGGMYGIMNTIWLIICAMIFGGVMEKNGMLERITESIIGAAHSTGHLIASTVASCLFFNVTASDQYLAIVVPGRMYADIYKKRGLAPQNLSRVLEDSGTVTSVLVPWNTCGAYQSGVLGVATIDYMGYCFFNILSPIVSITYGYLDITITKISEVKKELKAEELI